MAVTTSAVSVGTTATLLVTGGSGRSGGTVVSIKPAVGVDGDLVFLGGIDVATTNGLPLGAGVSLDLAPGETLYGRVASGTQIVRVLEHG